MSNSSAFPYEAVEDEAAVLVEELPAAKLSVDQARVIIDWHRRDNRAEIFFEGSRIFSRAIAWILAQKKIELNLYCLAFASGLDETWGIKSQSEVAKRFRITRAAISKRVIECKDLIGSKNTIFSRNDQTRQNCASAQILDHHKDEKPGAPRRFRRIA